MLISRTATMMCAPPFPSTIPFGEVPSSDSPIPSVDEFIARHHPMSDLVGQHASVPQDDENDVEAHGNVFPCESRDEAFPGPISMHAVGELRDHRVPDHNFESTAYEGGFAMTTLGITWCTSYTREEIGMERPPCDPCIERDRIGENLGSDQRLEEFADNFHGISFWALLMMQQIGHGYLLWLQFLLLVGSKLLFLSFDKGPHSGLQEACWQILRGVFWCIVTAGFTCHTRKLQEKRLLVVQGRRYSINVHKRCDVRWSPLIMACLVLNTHAIPPAQLATFDAMHIDGFPDVHLQYPTWTYKRSTNNPARDDLDCQCHTDNGADVVMYGDHTSLGSTGIRRAKLTSAAVGDLSEWACSFWSTDDYAAPTLDCH